MLTYVKKLLNVFMLGRDLEKKLITKRVPTLLVHFRGKKFVAYMAEISGHHHNSDYPQESHLYISCKHPLHTDVFTKTSQIHDFLHSDGVARHNARYV